MHIFCSKTVDHSDEGESAKIISPASAEVFPVKKRLQLIVTQDINVIN